MPGVKICNNCGGQVMESHRFCPACGAPAGVRQPDAQLAPQLRCPRCGGADVAVQLVEAGQRTARKGPGLAGHANNVARGAAAVATLGVSSLFWRKSYGANVTETVNATMGVCQACGTAWRIGPAGRGQCQQVKVNPR